MNLFVRYEVPTTWFGSEDAYPQGDGRGVTLPSSRSTWCVSVNAQSEYDSDYDTSFLRDAYDCHFCQVYFAGKASVA